MEEPIDFDSFDIIHSHCFRPDKYVKKWKHKINKSKIITTLHQDTYRSFRYEYNWALSHLLTNYWLRIQSNFDGIISISNQLKVSYEHKVKAPMITIHNGCSIMINDEVDSNIRKKILYIKEKYNVLGTYAFVTRRKGLDQIIKVLVKLPDYAFVIIGEGPDIKNLKKMSSRLGVDDRVLFFPYQKNPCDFLPYFDIYVMPSYSEGFGLAMVEAALAKLPIVCSDIPSFHEIFGDEDALFFPLSNIETLALSINKAFIKKDYYSEKSYKRAVGYFTTKVMAENHLKYYKSMISDIC